MVENWSNIFLTLAKQYIPNKDVRIKSDDLPYMNSHLKNLIRNKDNFFSKKYEKSGLAQDHEVYKTHRNALVSELRKAEKAYYDKISRDLQINSNDSKIWWKLVKKATKGKIRSTHDTPLCSDGLLVNDDHSKAEMLNEFYTRSVQTECPEDPIPNNHNLLYYPSAPSFSISEHEVYGLLNKLSPDKASGPDGIGNTLLPIPILLGKQVEPGPRRSLISSRVFP